MEFLTYLSAIYEGFSLTTTPQRFFLAKYCPYFRFFSSQSKSQVFQNQTHGYRAVFGKFSKISFALGFWLRVGCKRYFHMRFGGESDTGAIKKKKNPPPPPPSKLYFGIILDAQSLSAFMSEGWGRGFWSSHTWLFPCWFPPCAGKLLGPQLLPSAQITLQLLQPSGVRSVLVPWWRHRLLWGDIHFIMVGVRRTDSVPVCPRGSQFMLMSFTVCSRDSVFLRFPPRPLPLSSLPVSTQWTTRSSTEMKTRALHSLTSSTVVLNSNRCNQSHISICLHLWFCFSLWALSDRYEGAETLIPMKTMLLGGKISC